MSYDIQPYTQASEMKEQTEQTNNNQVLFLSDINASDESNIHGHLHKDCVYYSPFFIKMNNKGYSKGLGMHAANEGVSYVRYKLDNIDSGKYNFFMADVGLTEPKENTQGV